MTMRLPGGLAVTVMMASAAALAQAVGHPADMRAAHAARAGMPAKDARQLVRFPEPLRIHTLANMRDHLRVLGELNGLLAAGDLDKAAGLAESRLGMSSLEAHGAAQVAKYMPKGMQDAGSAMHRAASEFARIATDASVTGDPKEPLQALSTLTQTCVACHDGYRLQ